MNSFYMRLGAALLASSLAASGIAAPPPPAHQPPVIEKNWKCDCPGRQERQFLPKDMAGAKEWAAKVICAAKGRCPGGRGCEKQIVIVRAKLYIAARVDCRCRKLG
jgi:hypothetical protein